jgi:hypothetical protein
MLIAGLYLLVAFAAIRTHLALSQLPQPATFFKQSVSPEIFVQSEFFWRWHNYGLRSLIIFPSLTSRCWP